VSFPQSIEALRFGPAPIHLKHPGGNMKKFFAIMFIIILTLSLLTACGGNGNSGTGNSDNSSTPSAADNTTPADTSGNNDAETAKTDAETAKTPVVTVNPGDVVFDNDTVTILYEAVAVDSVSMDIRLQSTNNGENEITVTSEDLVINGVSVGIGYSFKNISPSNSSSDHWIILTHENLELEGFSAEDIQTVQITFTVTPLGQKDILFKGAARFNIESI